MAQKVNTLRIGRAGKLHTLKKWDEIIIELKTKENVTKEIRIRVCERDKEMSITVNLISETPMMIHPIVSNEIQIL